MDTTYRKEKSYNGYTTDVLRSALQKYIRRCQPDKAVYAAAEMDLFSMAENQKDGEKIRTNLIHRLMIIYLEDISNAGMWPWIDKMIFDLLSLRKGRKDEPMMTEKSCVIRRKEIKNISDIVYNLCISVHGRDNSFYRFCVYKFLQFPASKQSKFIQKFQWLQTIRDDSKKNYQPSKKPSLDIPDDLKNLAYNFLGAFEQRNNICIYFAYKISEWEELLPIRLYNKKKPVYLIFYLIEFFLKNNEEYKRYIPYVDIGVRWFFEINNDEAFLSWQNLIIIILKNEPFDFSYKENNEEELYKRNIDYHKIEFDDWVYDMHTAIGRSMKRNTSYFAKEGSVVCNESDTINKEYKKAYIYNKMLEDGIEEDEKKEDIMEVVEEKKESDKESEYAKFMVRAQLVTSDTKTDTYFSEKGGKIVFIKGPFLDVSHMKEFLKVQQMKKTFGIPFISYECVLLYPDLFTDTPLGLRKKIDKKKLYPFLVADVLFDYTVDNFPTKYHSSKVWPETLVPDWDKSSNIHVEIEMLKNENLMREYIENVVFRYMFGMPDLAKRNFVIYKNHVYSVDEETFGKDFDLEGALKNFYPVIEKYIKKNKEWFGGVLKKYMPTYKDKVEELSHRF